jgi:DsbC/DsbD-like thiol-disulfide interchange protein
MPILALVLALAGSFSAQRPTDIVKWSGEPPSKAVRAGAVAKIGLSAKVESGWKLYAVTQPKGGPIPLAIALGKDAPFTLMVKDITSPAPKVQKDEVFSTDTQYYEEEVGFVVPVGVPKTAAPGEHVVPLDVTFQACGKELCLRPFTHRIEVKVTVVK